MAAESTGTDQPRIPLTTIETDENAQQTNLSMNDEVSSSSEMGLWNPKTPRYIEVLRKFGVAEIILGTILVILSIVTLISSFTHSFDGLQKFSQDRDHCLDAFIWSRICQGLWCGMTAIVTGACAFDFRRKVSKNRYVINMIAASCCTVILIIGVTISITGVVLSDGCFTDVIALLIVTALISTVLVMITVIHTIYCICMYSKVEWRYNEEQISPQTARLFNFLPKFAIAEICLGLTLILMSIGILIHSHTTYNRIDSRPVDDMFKFYHNGKNCQSALTWSRICQGIWCGIAAIITGSMAFEFRSNWNYTWLIWNIIATHITAILLIIGIILSIKAVVLCDGCFMDLFALHTASVGNCFALLAIIVLHAFYCYAPYFRN